MRLFAACLIGLSPLALPLCALCLDLLQGAAP